MTDPARITKVFRALSVDTRVRIVQLLKKHPLCVGALAARLDVTPAAVSQHLRILRGADLVTADKQGYYVHYRINEKTLAAWRKLADELLETQTE